MTKPDCQVCKTAGDGHCQECGVESIINAANEDDRLEKQHDVFSTCPEASDCYERGTTRCTGCQIEFKHEQEAAE